MSDPGSDWDIVIKPSESWRDNFSWKQIRKYRDLMWLLVKRDVVAVYMQTILGRVWFFIQPVFTMAVYILVFGLIADLGTDNIPMPLFYLSGVIMWGYFSTMLTTTGSTFITNQALFSKVYFPRVIVPLSLLYSNGLKFLIQFVLFLIVYIVYAFKGQVSIGQYWFLMPLCIVLIAIQGLAGGLIVSSLATRYRDFNFLVKFGVDLLRYATPIVYPMSLLFKESAGGTLKYLIMANPMTGILDGFKVACFETSFIQPYFWETFAYSTVFTFAMLFVGMASFHRVEKKFIDTV
ncbi:MAG: ABC transporter permease [Flavobacteriales bacterium]|nr:ABC transporter permease [Flavobacteriales bacterium]